MGKSNLILYPFESKKIAAYLKIGLVFLTKNIQNYFFQPSFRVYIWNFSKLPRAGLKIGRQQSHKPCITDFLSLKKGLPTQKGSQGRFMTYKAKRKMMAFGPFGCYKLPERAALTSGQIWVILAEIFFVEFWVDLRFCGDFAGNFVGLAWVFFWGRSLHPLRRWGSSFRPHFFCGVVVPPSFFSGVITPP